MENETRRNIIGTYISESISHLYGCIIYGCIIYGCSTYIYIGAYWCQSWQRHSPEAFSTGTICRLSGSARTGLWDLSILGVPEHCWQLGARWWRRSPCPQLCHQVAAGTLSGRRGGSCRRHPHARGAAHPSATLTGHRHLISPLSPRRKRQQCSQEEAEEDLRRELGIFLFLIFLLLLFQYGVHVINKSDLSCGKAFQILSGLLPTYLSASGCCSLLSSNCHHFPPPDKPLKCDVKWHDQVWRRSWRSFGAAFSCRAHWGCQWSNAPGGSPRPQKQAAGAPWPHSASRQDPASPLQSPFRARC